MCKGDKCKKEKKHYKKEKHHKKSNSCSSTSSCGTKSVESYEKNRVKNIRIYQKRRVVVKKFTGPYKDCGKSVDCWEAC